MEDSTCPMCHKGFTADQWNNRHWVNDDPDNEYHEDCCPNCNQSSLDVYQQEAARTLLDTPGFNLTARETMITWNVVGLTGEAGEVAELCKKQLFHKKEFDREAWEKELGDVLWYVAAIATHLGLTLDQIATANITKLRERYPGEGYDPSHYQS